MLLLMRSRHFRKACFYLFLGLKLKLDGSECELLDKKLKDKDLISEDLKMLLKIPTNSRDAYDGADDVDRIE